MIGKVLKGTERLYYTDSHLYSFRAKVLRCEQSGEVWHIVLDRTAFFPEGGGQQADTGILAFEGPNPVELRVLDVHERNGEILHYCDGPLPEGTEVEGRVNGAVRFARMQNHSGEHILSGTAHSLYGCDNVGFHMGESDVTIDFNLELSEEELLRLEELTNEAVWKNLPVRIWYPTSDELKTLEYRSKIEIEGDVRIVEIPGVDRCACCAPHVSSTGEIGLVKILQAERHRGGMRLFVACGLWAIQDYRKRQQSAAEISALLSAKRDEITSAVEKLLQARDALKEKNAAVATELMLLRAQAQPETEGNICLFETLQDSVAIRGLVNQLMEKCTGLAAVFFPGEAGGYRYIIGSRSMDLRKAAKAINAGIGGRGGGSPEMIQGSAGKTEEEISAFLMAYSG